MHTVRVAPADAWWAVQSDAFDNEMLFMSGGRAEAAARRLALSLAARGEVVKLELKARDGSTVGRFVCPPATSVEQVRPEPIPALA